MTLLQLLGGVISVCSILSVKPRLSLDSADPKERMQIIPWNKEILLALFRFFLGTAAGSLYIFLQPVSSDRSAETIAFHGGIVLSFYIIMNIAELILTPQSNIRKEFR